MQNLNRKRYVHLVGDEVTTDEDVPWGADAMLTLKFVEEGAGGRYAIEVFDGRYLSTTGALKKDLDDSCKFVLQFFNQAMAFKQNIGGGEFWGFGLRYFAILALAVFALSLSLFDMSPSFS